MNKNILVTESEHREHMTLLSDKIYDLSRTYRALSDDIQRIEHPNRLDPYKGSLTVAELKELQENVKDRQHDLFRKWYAMNKRRQELGLDFTCHISDVVGHIVGVTRYIDVIQEARP